MNSLENGQTVLTPIQEAMKKAWWLEVATKIPECIYYFGPFESATEAEIAQAGHVEDLEREKAQGITAKVELCQPTQLTISKDELL